MEGLLEVVVAKELHEKGEIDASEYGGIFTDKTVMRFSSLVYAINFGRGFVQDYLIPKYGLEESKRFPMARSQPTQVCKTPDEAADKLGEFIGVKSRDPNKEAWLVIPNDRYQEVQEYLDSLK